MTRQIKGVISVIIYFMVNNLYVIVVLCCFRPPRKWVKEPKNASAPLGYFSTERADATPVQQRNTQRIVNKRGPIIQFPPSTKLKFRAN